MVHSARPLAISRSSLRSNGAEAMRWGATISGERKENVLQTARRFPDSRPQLVECADAAYTALRKQHKPIADAFGFGQLVNCNNEAAPMLRRIAQNAHHLSRLAQVEAVERLVHEEKGLRREERERQHQAAAVAFG